MIREVRFPAFGLAAAGQIRSGQFGGPPAFRALQEHAEIQAILRTAEIAGGGLSLRDGAFVLTVDDARVDPQELAVRVTQAFERATLGGWNGLRALGMAPQGASVVWAGDVRGVWVRARPEGPGARVEAPIRPAFPRHTVVIHADHGTELGAGQFEDMMLGRLLDVTSDDVAAVEARLARDAVRGLVLELLHGLPGSRLLPSHIEVVHPQPLADPLALVRQVVQLVEALREV